MKKFLKNNIFSETCFHQEIIYFFQIEIETFSYQEAETLPELGSPQS